MACFSHFETAPNPLFHGVFSLQVHFSADALDQRTTVERGKLRKALGAEKLLKLHEVISGVLNPYTKDCFNTC